MECAYHPGKDAVSRCSECGKPLCEECGKALGTRCPDCAVSQIRASSGETARHSLMNWKGWIYSFIGYSASLRRSLEEASFAGVAMNILVGLINACIISVLFVILTAKPEEWQKVGTLMNSFIYTSLFLLFIGTWLINSLISYSFAMLAGGVGSLKQHIYILSLLIPFSPIFIVAVWELLSFLFSLQIGAGILATILLGMYLIRIHANAMMEAHKFKLMQAAISWSIPCALSMLGVGLLIFITRKI
ncbi:MAG: B-box zinc finger protein [Candidatus Micrarchaeota archaeon]|nr:B-box zinc finger protein [Candidatus Micrarchaeota archaeon]